MIFSDIYKNKLLKNIRQYVISNYIKLNIDDFELGEIPYNFRCHLNAVQKVKENKAEKVYLVIAMDKEDLDPIIHFINKKGEKYIDNTWGWTFTKRDYYLIREIQSIEYDNIGNILQNTRKSLLNLFSKQWVRSILLKNDLII